jgi:hypothetical protein
VNVFAKGDVSKDGYLSNTELRMLKRMALHRNWDFKVDMREDLDLGKLIA